MPAASVRLVVRRLGPSGDPPSDSELVRAFVTRGDHAAFAELVHRHGPTVLGVCRRVLGHAHDAEDAFQAVFLVLARKANTIRPAGAVGGWLYGVAVRTANKAKVAAARRRRREMASVLANRGSERAADTTEMAELRAILDAELARLPAAVRATVVLCDLHGKTRAEAAAELGCPEGTVAARLHRGRKKLAGALTRRGLVLPATGLIAVLTPVPVSADLSQSAVTVASGTASAAVLALARGVIRSMTTNTFTLGLLTLAAGGLFALTVSGAFSAPDLGANPGEPTMVTIPVERPAPDPKPEPAAGYVTHIEFAPDGKRYVVVAGGEVRAYDAESHKATFAAKGEAARYSADGKKLFVMGANKVLECDADTGKVLKEFPRPKSKWGWHLVAFAPDGKRYAAHFGHFAGLYDTATGFEPARLGGQDEGIPGWTTGVTGKQLLWSPDGKRLAVVGIQVGGLAGGPSGKMGAAVWDAETGDRLNSIEPAFDDGPRAAAFSPDGKTLAIGYKKNVWLYDPLKEIKKLADTPGPVTALAYSRDGKILAVGFRKPIPNGADRPPAVVGYKTEVQVLDADSGKELKRFDGFEGVNHTGPTVLPVTTLAFGPDGKRLLAGTGILPLEAIPENAPKKGELKVFALDADKPPAQDAAAWKETRVLELSGWLAGSVAYSADGKILFVGGTSGTGRVRAYDTASWMSLWDVGVGTKFPAVALSPDGKTLAVTVKNGAQFLDAATGKAGDLLEQMESEPLAVAFFPDKPVLNKDTGQLLATSRQVIFGNARGYAVKTWLKWPLVSTITTSTVEPQKKTADNYAVPLAVDPEGKRAVVTGPIDRETGLNVLWAWSAGSGAANELLTGHKAPVTAAAWSRDGKLIVTGDADGVVITWDPATFKEKSRLKLDARVVAVAVTAGGLPGDGELQGKVVRRLSDGIVEINIGSDVAIRPGQTFTVLPKDFPEKGRQSRTHKVGIPDEGGKYKTVEQFVEKASVEVIEVLGPNVSRCRITKEFDPIRDAAAAGDLLYKPVGNKSATYAAAAVVRPVGGVGQGAYAEEVFIWPAGSPPEKPEPISSHKAGAPFNGLVSLAFAPDGKSLASAFCNFVHLSRLGELAGTVRVFALEAAPPAVAAPGPWREKAALKDHNDPVTSVAFAPDGNTFVTAGVELLDAGGQTGVSGEVILWDAVKREPVWSTYYNLNKTECGHRFAAAFSPDGKLVAVTTPRGIEMRDARTGKVAPGGFQEKGVEPAAVEFSPDGKWVGISDGLTSGCRAVAPGDGSAFARGPKELEAEADKFPAAIAWSPESLYLAYALPVKPDDGLVGVIGVTPEAKPRNLSGHKGRATAVAWSKEGNLIATGGADGTVILWDAGKFEELRRVDLGGRGGKSTIYSLAFTADGKTLAAAREFDEGKNPLRVALIDTATGKVGQDLQFFWAPPLAVAFSPDGKTLLVGCGYRESELGRLTGDQRKKAGEVRVFTTESE